MADETKKGRHANSGNRVTAWAGLPIFSLVGGTVAGRGEFLLSLQSWLAKKALDLAILPGEEPPGSAILSLSARHHDLVIVDGPSHLPLQRINFGESGDESAGELFCPGPGIEALSAFAGRLVTRLDELVKRTPVWACVLIGGKSSRMGRPKHLIAGYGERTWLEKTIDLLRPLVDGIVVAGKGQLPEPVAETIRLADMPGVVGPLAGILSACRWQPQVSWLVVACDMPGITAAAVQWLLAERRAGCWGRVPRLPGSDHCEPLFAWYDCRAAQIFEDQLCTGNLRIGEAARHPRIDTPIVPGPLCQAFLNVNTPAELASAKP